MGNQVMEAFGLSNIYCGLSLSGANVVMVDGWNHHPCGIPYRGTSGTVKSEGLLGWQVHLWMSQHVCLHSMVCYNLGMAHQPSWIVIGSAVR